MAIGVGIEQTPDDALVLGVVFLRFSLEEIDPALD